MFAQININDKIRLGKQMPSFSRHHKACLYVCEQFSKKHIFAQINDKIRLEKHGEKTPSFSHQHKACMRVYCTCMHVCVCVCEQFNKKKKEKEKGSS